MDNAEKFKEVFGFEVDGIYSICNMLDCARCPFHSKNQNGEEKEQCVKKADDFWLDDYKDGNIDEYTRGLNDAWGCARKLVHPDRGGLSTNAKIAICGKPDSDYILLEYSAAEAIAKIKEFEESEQRMAKHRKMIKEYITKYGREAFDKLVESIKKEEME